MSERVHHYELHAAIAAGGAGVVYRAQDTRTGSAVALKVLRASEADDEDLRRRFGREARAMRAVAHPNVVRCVDAGLTEEGLPFVVTEWVEGSTLRDLIRNGPMPAVQALRIAIDISSALEAVHAAGVVHRDVKPDNFVVTESGSVKMIDFGLSRFAGRTSYQTRAGTILGSVHYLSPEQAQGKVVDARSDLWSVGVILFEMLSGAPPFSRESAVSTLVAIAEQPCPGVPGPPETAAVIQRCLRKHPAERYTSARLLGEDLREALQHASAPAWLRAWRRMTDWAK